MAESSSFRQSTYQDQQPATYCEHCYYTYSNIKHVKGYCLTCDESLCQECYDSHLRRTRFRNHKLQVEKPTRRKSKSQYQHKHRDFTAKCPRHHGENNLSFCKTHFQTCCKVCLTINHQTCDTEDISKMARNNQTSVQLEELNQKLSDLSSGFNDNLSKAEIHSVIVQTNYTRAIDEMKTFWGNDFNELMIETTNDQVHVIRDEDSTQIQSIIGRCKMEIGQINKIKANIEQLNDKGDDENIFILMAQVEHELQSLQDSLSKLATDNTVREYTIEPDLKFKDLGELSFLQATHFLL